MFEIERVNCISNGFFEIIGNPPRKAYIWKYCDHNLQKLLYNHPNFTINDALQQFETAYSNRDKFEMKEFFLISITDRGNSAMMENCQFKVEVWIASLLSLKINDIDIYCKMSLKKGSSI